MQEIASLMSSTSRFLLQQFEIFSILFHNDFNFRLLIVKLSILCCHAA